MEIRYQSIPSEGSPVPPDEPEPAPEKPRAKGRALPRSGVQIDRLSEVSELDILNARKAWKARAPERLKGLIEAKPEKEES